MFRISSRLTISFVLILCLACNGSGLMEVSGDVKFNGSPVEDGRIQFRALDGDKKAYSSTIKNGAYSIECKPGKMSVEITASRIIPGKFDNSNGEKSPVGEMYIPAKYNSKTELVVEVSVSNANHSFDLKK